MSVVINTNQAATLAADNLAASNRSLQRSLNRLSSGSRIVSPQDDAAGLAVSLKLSATARRQSAAASNIGNGVSFLQTQDGALKVLGKTLDRIGELKTLYADPTKNSDDLANYQAEFEQLQSQITSLASEKFNGKALFSSTDLSVSTTADAGGTVELTGIQLLAGSGTTTNLTLDTNSTPFTPSGAGTLTVTSGDLDFVDTGGTYLNDGESATYDGNGNWTLPASGGRSNITGSPGAINLSTLNEIAGTATFTTNGAATSLGDVANATDLGSLSLSTVTDALQEVATHRANNGAQQSRLQFAAEVLQINQANVEAANSRIIDVDVATESTQLARYNILVQSGTSMLAQANQSAQMALKLLG